MRRIGGGPPVVVLHGGPGAHHDYLLPGFDALADGRELIYYDQRGGGRSPVPRDVPVGWTEHVADLEALRAQWGLDRLTIVGYSWGGLLALLYALEHRASGSSGWRWSPPLPPGARRGRSSRQRFGKRNLDPEFQEARRAASRERTPGAGSRGLPAAHLRAVRGAVLPRPRARPRPHAVPRDGPHPAGSVGEPGRLRSPRAAPHAPRHPLARPPRRERPDPAGGRPGHRLR